MKTTLTSLRIAHKAYQILLKGNTLIPVRQTEDRGLEAFAPLKFEFN